MATAAPRRPTAPASTPEAATPGVRTDFRWTRERYDQAVEAGVFTPDDKVELIEGQIVAKMPQNKPHEVATGLVSDALRDAFGSGTHTRDEKSVALTDLSKPEPDVAVVRGSRRDYLKRSPAPDDVLLVVEVAESSLRADRTNKALLYADAGITEYWIVNLVEGVLEVHRDPAGGVYQTKTTLRPGETVAPVARPDAPIAVADLLP